MCHEIQYGCGHSTYHVPREQWHHHKGCCCTPGYGQRQFPTIEEVIGELEEYLKQLQAEARGVKERIAELRKNA